MIKVLFFVTLMWVLLTCMACNRIDYDFAKKVCAERGSKLKSYHRDPMDGGYFQCEDLFSYD